MDNIAISYNDPLQPVLLDFGLSSLPVGTDPHAKGAGCLLYMPPETRIGKADELLASKENALASGGMGPAADVWACGLVACQLLARMEHPIIYCIGQACMQGRIGDGAFSNKEVLKYIGAWTVADTQCVIEYLEYYSEDDKKIPTEVIKIISSMLHPDPDQRPTMKKLISSSCWREIECKQTSHSLPSFFTMQNSKLLAAINATNCVKSTGSYDVPKQSRLALLRDSIKVIQSSKSALMVVDRTFVMSDEMLSRLKTAFIENETKTWFGLVGSGSLSRESLERVLRELDGVANHIDIGSLFTLMDEDENNQVDRRELFAALTFLLGAHISPEMQMKLLFTAYDFDNSGSLDKKEFQELVNALGVPLVESDGRGGVAPTHASKLKNADNRLKTLFYKLDTDKNGSLSLDEFIAGLKSEAQLASMFLGRDTAGHSISYNRYVDKQIDDLNAKTKAKMLSLAVPIVTSGGSRQ